MEKSPRAARACRSRQPKNAGKNLKLTKSNDLCYVDPSSKHVPRRPRRVNIEHLIGPEAEATLIQDVSRMDPATRALCFRQIVEIVASIKPGQDPNAPIDIVEGAYVTKLFAKRLEKKLFGRKSAKS